MYVALFSPQVSALICAKGFIKFKQVIFANTLDNQRVSNTVFSVSSYIRTSVKIGANLYLLFLLFLATATVNGIRVFLGASFDLKVR